MIKVAWVSTWATRCGIAEYSRYLVNALWKRDDIEVAVFGSKNYGKYALYHWENNESVHPTFAVLPWNEKGDHSFDIEYILEEDFDILHIQYEVLLYNQEKLYQLLHQFKGKKVITYHDNCIPPNFPYHQFNLAYTHREDVGVGQGYVLPMGLENKPPTIKTFGLGRSRKDIIGEVCERNGWNFQYSFGEATWLDQDTLYEWLRDSDAIVLYYDDADAAGTSIAARVAISTRRPVIINDVTWFKDLFTKSDIPNLYRVYSPETLEVTLTNLLKNPELELYNWDEVARIHVQDYKELLVRDVVKA